MQELANGRHLLSELIGATTLNAYADLGNLIATERPGRYAPSIYRMS